MLGEAPQPLAESVAALDGARNTHQARDAARELIRANLTCDWEEAHARYSPPQNRLASGAGQGSTHR